MIGGAAPPAANSAPQAPAYDAFISYRRAEPDATIARRLHTLLETYRAPRNLVARGVRPRLRAVFRDADDLSATPDLADEIQRVLEASRFLIVVCSPRSRASAWVAKEVESFLTLGRADRILLLLVEGEPSESFPAALLGADPLHRPLAADVRAPSTREMLARLGSERLRLLAAMLDCRYDELKQRELERTVRRLWMLAAVLSALLGAAALAIWQIAVSRARAEERTAELLVEQARSELGLGEYAAAHDRILEARAHGGGKQAAFAFLAARAGEMGAALRFDLPSPAPIHSVAFTGGGRLIVRAEGRIEIRDGATGAITATLDEAATGAGAGVVVSAGDFFTTGRYGMPSLLWDARTAHRVGELLEETLFDARGTRVLTWGKKGLRVVSVEDGSTVVLTREAVRSAVFSGAAQEHVFFGTSSAALRADARTGASISRFTTDRPVTSVAVDPTEKKFAFVTRAPEGGDPHVLYTDNAFERPPADLGPGLDTEDLHFTPNALVINEVSLVTVMNLDTGGRSSAMGAHELGSTNPLGSVAEDGSLFTTLGSYGVGVYRSADGASLHEFDADRYGVTFAKFGPRGPVLLTGGHEGVARLWDGQTGTLLATYRGFEPEVVGAFSQTGALALAGGRRLAVWEWAVGGPRTSLNVPLESYDTGVNGSSTHVVGVASGGAIVYLDGDSRLKRWDQVSAPADVAPSVDRGAEVRLSPDGSCLAAWGNASGGVVVPLRGGTSIRLQGGPKALSFSPDGRRIFGRSASGAGLWDAATGRLVGALTGVAPGTTTDWSPRGALLATAGDSVAIWDTASGVLRTRVPTRAPLVAFLGEGAIATLDRSGALEMWDVAAGRRIKSLREPAGDEGGEGDAVLTADRSGRFIAAANSGERGLRIYDVRTGAVVRQVQTRSVGAVAFLREGALLLVGESSVLGGQVILFDVSTGQILRTYDGQLVNATDERMVTARAGGIDVWELGEAQALRQ